MFCSFCKKGASKLATHYLCDCCLVHLECWGPTMKNQLATPVTKNTPGPEEDVDKGKPVCDICLEEYPEDELQQHQEKCMARLVFRCTICNGDYVSKEGLWNHLDLHEISDGSKEIHYQEMRATYEVHKCVLCNDQRGYQESHYWKHVHEDHDGFFLRCLGCGENFRSEKRKTDHALNHCKVREQSVTSNSGGLKMDQTFIDIVLPVHVKAAAQYGSAVIHLELTQEEQSLNNPEMSLADLNKKSLVPEVSNKELDLSSTEYHQMTCHSERQYKCAYCSHIFHLKDDLCHHMSQHLLDPKSVGLNGQKSSLVQPEKSDFYEINHDLIHVDQEHVDPQFSEVNFADKTVTRLPSKDTTKVSAEDTSQPVEKQLNESSNIHCPHCDKKFHSKSTLTHHIEYCHDLTTCDICGFTATNKNKILYHKLTNHTEPQFKCSRCPRMFHMKHLLRLHEMRHRKIGVIERLEPIFITERRKKRAFKVMNQSAAVVCEHCNETIAGPFGIERHIYHVYAGLQVKCGVCDLKFPS